MVYKLFNKKSATQKGTGINSENQQLAEELHNKLLKYFKSINFTFLKCNIFSSGIMILSIYNYEKILKKKLKFYYVIDVFSKYTWVVSWRTRQYYNY